MQGNTQKITSPERSRSIKLKVSNKIFPEDFFKRSNSQSPIKQMKKLRYLKQNMEKATNPELGVKNQLYWDIMREQLEKCRNITQKDKIKQAPRVWVYSEKKNRKKQVKKDEEIRFESRQQTRNLRMQQGRFFQSSPQSTKYQINQGLFTFFGKSPTKGNNSWLPPIN